MVPWLTSKEVSPKVVRKVASVAKRERVKVDVEQTADLTTALALAIMSLPRSFFSGSPTTCLGKCIGVEFPACDHLR